MERNLNAMGTGTSTPWICDRCTLENPANIIYCKACSNKKTISSRSSWLCQNCQANTPANYVFCNQCGCEKSSVSKSHLRRTKSFDNKNEWNCYHCTLLNPSSTDSCSACGRKRKREIIVVADSSPESNEDEETDRTKNSASKRLYPRLDIDLTVDVDSEVAQRSPDVLKCSQCRTILYDNLGFVCNVCGTRCAEDGFKPRPFPSSSLPSSAVAKYPSSSNGSWSCTKCTLRNEARQLACAACGNSREKEEPDSLSSSQLNVDCEGNNSYYITLLLSVFCLLVDTSSVKIFVRPWLI